MKKGIRLRKAPKVKVLSRAQSFCRVRKEGMQPMWRVVCKVDH